MRLILESLANFLINKEPRVPVFCVLPKIRKGDFLAKGYPVVSGSSLLELLSKNVNSFLQPLSEKELSYIKATQDFSFK